MISNKKIMEMNLDQLQAEHKRLSKFAGVPSTWNKTSFEVAAQEADQLEIYSDVQRISLRIQELTIII